MLLTALILTAACASKGQIKSQDKMPQSLQYMSNNK